VRKPLMLHCLVVVYHLFIRQLRMLIWCVEVFANHSTNCAELDLFLVMPPIV